ncbi:hypothetical protein HU200_023657 [Digitaria exilis]|uniref:SAC domain-containing protein n=1 Tax=Digitaria exilis TaxID=1010633 RepID=A0A835EYB9_9POAL|nr:hypothetical protein HU200_023657 [Digitaria exilis]
MAGRLISTYFGFLNSWYMNGVINEHASVGRQHGVRGFWDKSDKMLYLIGRDESNGMWRLLKIDRLEPTSLSVVEDPTCYTAIERDDLLRRIHAGNKVTGGLKRIECCGIIGFIKFLGPYYMLLITESRKIGNILGHDIYSVHKSKIITIPSSHVLPSVAESDDEKRFFKRGVNEDGHVANDVETEQIVFEETQDEIPCEITSVVQRRGSIPLFWSQETTKCPIKPEILLKSDKDYKATILHFEKLVAYYENPIIVLNLIKTVDKKPNELLLRREYAKGIEHINKSLQKAKHILYVHLDMNNHSLRGDVLPYLLSVGSASLKQTGIFHCKFTPNSESPDTARAAEVAFAQKGVLRTNCLDCLDRTNAAQFAYGLAALANQLKALGLHECKISVDGPLSHALMDVYGKMGDELSMQYAGSPAQNKVFWEQQIQCIVAITLKKYFRNIGRFVSNTYMDNGKQRALNVFLGLLRPQQGEPSGSAKICNRQGNPGKEEDERYSLCSADFDQAKKTTDI